MVKQRKTASGIQTTNYKPLSTEFVQKQQAYEQSAHMSAARVDGVNIKDKIFAGEIGESLNDPNRQIDAVQISASAKNVTQGRNKSGCLWKKGTSNKASSRNKSMGHKTWEKKMEERKKRDALKARIEELR